MKVLKFGGTSVANAQNIQKVIEIIKKERNQTDTVIVVVSALGGVTDKLSAVSEMASKQEEFTTSVQEIESSHLNTLNELSIDPFSEIHSPEWKKCIAELNKVLKGNKLLSELSPWTRDRVLAFGERLSSIIIHSAILTNGLECEHVDARKLIVTDSNYNSANIDFELTQKRIQSFWNDKKGLFILGGFIASDFSGNTTTLGRGGSDYTASIVGAALDVNMIEIWTDVDGVFTADPRFVEDAFPLESISYEEAAELAHFGAKVIHPKTMRPAREKNIPILIKNTFNPKGSGTRIHSISGEKNLPITGISSSGNISLIRLQSSHSRNITGITGKIYSALNNAGIEVLLTSQASSEQALCFGTTSDTVNLAKEIIEHTLELEIDAGLVGDIKIEKDVSIVAIVGERMKGVPGISGRLFDLLGKEGINIKAIAQGSSELNISTVVESKWIKKAIRAIHKGFFTQNKKSIHVFLAGTGLVGKKLLDIIGNLHLEDNAESLIVCGITNSRRMVVNNEGLTTYENLDWEPANLDIFVNKMIELNLDNSVFVDCTASGDVPNYYSQIINSKVHIVAANKKGNSSSLTSYQNLKSQCIKNDVYFFYETNVGAALPFIRTIRDLIDSGDKILEISGVFSGTLSFIFNSFNTSTESFSAIVRTAQSKGYTEPDPRDDLTGMDVKRKTLIVARECGFPIELDDINLDPFLPKDVFSAPDLNKFYGALERSNPIFEEKRIATKEKGKKLCYLANVKDGEYNVSLSEIDSSHPFYNLNGSDNIISIKSERYFESPLIIRGHGAGADVTAAGVLTDILRTIKR